MIKKSRASGRRPDAAGRDALPEGSQGRQAREPDQPGGPLSVSGGGAPGGPPDTTSTVSAEGANEHLKK